MRRAIGFILLLLAVAAAGIVVGRSIAAPTHPPTREKVLADLGFDRVIADVNFRALPLEDAIDFLRQKTSANLVVRWNELEKAGIDPKTPITLRVANLPLKRVLELVCDEAGTGQVVIEPRRGDVAIIISTSEDSARESETRLYDVQDLVRAHCDFRRSIAGAPQTDQPASGSAGGGGANVCFGGGGSGNGGSLFASAGSGSSQPYDDAIDTITHMITDYVAPDAWRDNGGTIGTIREYNGRLMITATPDMHDEIAALLELLRKGT